MELPITKDTKMCVSLSARPGNFGTRFQNFLFQKSKLDFIYKAFQISDIEGALQGIRALGIRGSAISMPFKETCIEYLNALDASAEKVGSVNTIVNSGGNLFGYNTDYSAVRFLLKKFQMSRNLRFALHGSGGMAKAVAWALSDEGFKNGVIISRNETTGRSLAEKVGVEWAPELMDDSINFLINATPLGMTGGPDSEKLSFSQKTVSEADWIFDVVAVPVETPLISLARRLNKRVITGADVLVPQAVEQFSLYTGLRPPEEMIIDAARFAGAIG